jgi:hypothetical protein
MVPPVGLEPTRPLRTRDFKSPATTYYAMGAMSWSARVESNHLFALYKNAAVTVWLLAEKTERERNRLLCLELLEIISQEFQAGPSTKENRILRIENSRGLYRYVGVAGNRETKLLHISYRV